MCNSMLSLTFFIYSTYILVAMVKIEIRPKKWSRALTGGGPVLEVPTVRL